METQAKTNAAFDNYLALSNVLMDDGQFLLDMEQTDSRWQRIFIRTAAALIEGYSSCFRDIASIGLDYDQSPIPTSERQALSADTNMRTTERIKLTLRAIYRLLRLSPAPDFGNINWHNAKLALEKRHALMHPKTVDDLELGSELWEKIHAGLAWLIEQHFNVLRAVHERHIGNAHTHVTVPRDQRLRAPLAIQSINLNRPQRYQIRLLPNNCYQLRHTGKPVRFSAPATKAGIAKLYVVSLDGRLLYVGIAKQPMASRIKSGLKAQGEGGYHGYKWKSLEQELTLTVWTAVAGSLKEMGAIEAEVVFLCRRTSGRWPEFQHEIHFCAPTQAHRDAAARVYNDAVNVHA